MDGKGAVGACRLVGVIAYIGGVGGADIADGARVLLRDLSVGHLAGPCGMGG